MSDDLELLMSGMSKEGLRDMVRNRVAYIGELRTRAANAEADAAWQFRHRRKLAEALETVEARVAHLEEATGATNRVLQALYDSVPEARAFLDERGIGP